MDKEIERRLELAAAIGLDARQIWPSHFGRSLWSDFELDFHLLGALALPEFDHRVALQLCEGGRDRQHRRALGPSRIQSFCQGTKTCSPFPDALDEVQDAAGVAAQTVEQRSSALLAPPAKRPNRLSNGSFVRLSGGHWSEPYYDPARRQSGVQGDGKERDHRSCGERTSRGAVPYVGQL